MVLTTQMLLGKVFEMSNKLNKIWLKGLNSNISKIGDLIRLKFQRRTNFNFHQKLKDQKHI